MIELESKLIFFFEPYEFHILDLTITKCQTIFDALHIYWVHNVKMSSIVVEPPWNSMSTYFHLLVG